MVLCLVLDVLGEDVEAVDLGGEARGDRRDASCRLRSEMSRALPAVSAATIGLMPSLRMMRRHWPSAWTWLSHALDVGERSRPSTAISWWRIGKNHSPTM